jgi:hypothetical protein
VKKTSIYLDADLDRALTRLAHARGLTKAETIRRALARAVADTPQPRATAIGVIDGPGDVADNVDRYLAEGFGED